jgi:hypothetical protein
MRSEDDRPAIRQILSGMGYGLTGLAIAYLVFAVTVKAIVPGFWFEFSRVSLVGAGAVVLGVMLIKIGCGDRAE